MTGVLVYFPCVLSFHLLCILFYSSHLASSSPLHLYLPGFSSASLSTPLHPYLILGILIFIPLHPCLHVFHCNLVYSSAYFSTPLYRCRLLFILVDYFSSLSTSPYPCPLSLLVYSSAVCICLYSSVSLVLVHFSSLPYCPESPEKGDPSTHELLRLADSIGPVSPTCNRFIRPKAGNAP